MDNLFQSRLEKVIDEITVDVAQEITGVNRSTVYNWRNGSRKLPLYAAAILCEKYGCTVDWLVSGREKEDAKWIDVPVWSGLVAGGAGSIVDSRMITKHKYKKSFAKNRKLHKVQVTGNSMDRGISIKDKDWICVDENQKKLKDGGVYVLLTGDGYIVKQIFLTIDGGIKLVSTNPDYEVVKVEKDQLEFIQVFGEVVEHSHHYI